MFRTRIQFRNTRHCTVPVWIEPWAKEFTLEQDEALQVECVASEEGTLEVEFHDSNENDAIVVFGFPGSKMRAVRDGKVVWECHEPLPPLPE